jgi:hypothetical protein
MWHELQIARFDIAMNDGRFLAMQEGERVGKLVAPGKHICFFKEELFSTRFKQQCSQIIPWNEIHHEIITRPI